MSRKQNESWRCGLLNFVGPLDFFLIELEKNQKLFFDFQMKKNVRLKNKICEILKIKNNFSSHFKARKTSSCICQISTSG